jgi:tellurite resistance protein TerA
MAIILEKSGDKHRINLEKGGKSLTGEIKINLDWSKGGLLKQMF